MREISRKDYSLRKRSDVKHVRVLKISDIVTKFTLHQQVMIVGRKRLKTSNTVNCLNKRTGAGNSVSNQDKL